MADSGQAALHLLKDHAYDIILMDVMLGTWKALRSSGPAEPGYQDPVMIVSGRNEDYDSLYGLSIGADDYITKPFRPLVLGAKVKALIRRSRNLSSDSPDQLECGPFHTIHPPCVFIRTAGKSSSHPRRAALCFCS